MKAEHAQLSILVYFSFIGSNQREKKLSGRQLFEFIDEVEATWEIIDRLSRMVWERKDVPLEKQRKIDQAARNFHTELTSSSRNLPRRNLQRHEKPPRGADVDTGQAGSGFRQFIVDRLANLVTSKDVGSVAEAFIKATPVLEAFRGSLGDREIGFVFRGQSNISWPLIPSLGRNPEFLEYLKGANKAEFLEGRFSKTSQFELNLLAEFKAEWSSLEEVEAPDRLNQISPDDPSWWFRMQHYGNAGFGTRLLDVTSSIPAALLFACLNWETGLVDDTTDGVLYLFAVGMNSNRVDFRQSALPKIDRELFEGFPEAPVHFLNPPHTERSKAQSGSFLWWPEFWREYPHQITYLRVPKECKSAIARELLLMNFGPKDIVRGKKGNENEDRLRDSLKW